METAKRVCAIEKQNGYKRLEVLMMRRVENERIKVGDKEVAKVMASAGEGVSCCVDDTGRKRECF